MAAARPPPPSLNPPAPQPAPLGRLLDRLERVHKADVRELTGGHLNESRLYRPPEPPRRNRLLEQQQAGRRGAAASAMGAEEFAAEPRVPVRRVRLPAAATPGSEPVPPCQSRPSQTSSSDDIKPELHRETLVEELLAPSAPPQRLLAPAAGEGSHAGNYRRTRMVKKRLIREQDTMEQDLMSGYAAVRDLEIRLQENLRQHFSNSSGPSFHRLQMYSAALDEIISQSATFGSLLEGIKMSYDDYLAWLLDATAPAQHRHLRAQLAQLRDPRAESELADARIHLDQLEAAAEAALAGLAESRRRLAEAEAAFTAEEASAAAAPPPPPPPAPLARDELEAESSGDRCERLLREIWTSLDAAADLRRELRATRSPLVCATHLEHCYRQAHADMQAVEEELARIRTTNQTVADGLLTALAAADGEPNPAADPDAYSERQRVLRLLGSEAAAAALATENLDLETDLLAPNGRADDAHKWDWYIS